MHYYDELILRLASNPDETIKVRSSKAASSIREALNKRWSKHITLMSALGDEVEHTRVKVSSKDGIYHISLVNPNDFGMLEIIE